MREAVFGWWLVRYNIRLTVERRTLFGRLVAVGAFGITVNKGGGDLQTCIAAVHSSSTCLGYHLPVVRHNLLGLVGNGTALDPVHMLGARLPVSNSRGGIMQG